MREVDIDLEVPKLKWYIAFSIIPNGWSSRPARRIGPYWNRRFFIHLQVGKRFTDRYWSKTWQPQTWWRTK